LADNQVSDGEFRLIMDEFYQYNVLKGAVRAKLTRKPSRPNIDKIKKEIRGEVELEYQKKYRPSPPLRIKIRKIRFWLSA